MMEAAKLPEVPLLLETERTRLRPWRELDWRGLQAYYGDEAATAHTVGRAFSEGETWRMLSLMVGHWALRGYGPYALEEKVSGELLGLAGYWYPNDWPDPEIKYALARRYWGQGYASEAVRALQKTWCECFPGKRLISFIHGENLPSKRLAEAVGAVWEEDRPFRGSTWSVYVHPDRSEG